ncbi:MAG: response regulator [Armatimonadota bacterium]
MSKSILIVEDDIEQRAMFALACTSVGYRVVAVPDSIAALETAVQQTFDLILADLYLPGCEGDLLIREMKLRQPHIKAVLMSCHQDISEALSLCPADGSYQKGDLPRLMSLILELVTPKTLRMQ